MSHSNTVHICTSRNHHLSGLKTLPPPSDIVGRLTITLPLPLGLKTLPPPSDIVGRLGTEGKVDEPLADQSLKLPFPKVIMSQKYICLPSRLTLIHHICSCG